MENADYDIPMIIVTSFLCGTYLMGLFMNKLY